MNSLNASLSFAGSSSGDNISKVSHAQLNVNDLQTVLNGRTYLRADIQEGDIIFWFGASCHDSFNSAGYLPPMLQNGLFKSLGSDYAAGTYKAASILYYHVVTEASKGMLIGFNKVIPNNYTSPTTFLYVVRGADPSSIASVERTRRTNTARPTFPSIDISSNDYILAMTASGANTTTYLPFVPSAGYDDSVILGSNLGSTGRRVSSGILLRKPGVSGSYTEPTWSLSGTDQTYFTNVSLVMRLSPK
tara:strand:+ start:1224 stop:1964 length:741 start_codon:yes stop_codon:yes gene_type:complete